MQSSRTFYPLVALAVLAAAAADARPHRPGQVPHGQTLGCGLCHNSQFGGDARNLFGQMVEQGFLTSIGPDGDVEWGPELAALDADGDGATNGEELQDPQGTWSPGDPAPGDASAVTRPGDPDSTPPPPEPTSVTASTWAQVKAVARRLLE